MWTTTVCSSQLLVEWCRFVFRDKCNQLNIWLPHSSNWMISVCKCGEVKCRAQQPIGHILVYRNLLFWIPRLDFQCFCVQLDYMTGVLRHICFTEFKGILLGDLIPLFRNLWLDFFVCGGVMTFHFWTQMGFCSVSWNQMLLLSVRWVFRLGQDIGLCVDNAHAWISAGVPSLLYKVSYSLSKRMIWKCHVSLLLTSYYSKLSIYLYRIMWDARKCTLYL